MEWEVGRVGGVGIVRALRATITLGNSVRAQLGLVGGRRKRGASKPKRMGIRSEPVEGSGWDHSAK